jgi:membrane protein YqaA with SNARE-associated domain
MRTDTLVFLHVNCFSLKTITHLLSRYTAWIWGLLHVLGIWGVFVIAFADSALLGMPVDAIVATYVFQHRARFFVYVLLAAVGSALGSIPLYIIGYIGGETVLRKRVSEERFQKIHRSFEEHEFWALMFPGMFPPPMPFKIFVLGAAISEMNFGHFLLAIFLARCVRFFALALLTLYFGPQIVGFLGTVIREHAYWAAVGLVVAGLVTWLLWMMKRNKSRNQAAEE